MYRGVDLGRRSGTEIRWELLARTSHRVRAAGAARRSRRDSYHLGCRAIGRRNLARAIESALVWGGMKAGTAVRDSWHLYEAVIGSAWVWLKLQASCPATEPAALFEHRFTGADYTPADGHRPLTPFRLSERSHYIANWSSIVESLPAGWDDEEYRIIETAYPWCETLADGCDCHGTKGRLDVVHCSDFGVVDQRQERSGKSRNIRYEYYIQEMEQRIAHRDEEQREERRQRAQHPPTRGATPARPTARRGTQPDAARTLAQALGRINGLVAEGFYCSIHGRHHAYGEQPTRQTVADLHATVAQVSGWPSSSDRTVAMSHMNDMAAHRLRVNQSQECAKRSVWDDEDIPDVLYKYIPKERIGRGAPDSLRATQLLSLNDDMECNVIAMKGRDDEALEFLRLVQSKVKDHMGIDVAWEDLLRRWNLHADVRLSTYVQEYLNPGWGSCPSARTYSSRPCGRTTPGTRESWRVTTLRR